MENVSKVNIKIKEFTLNRIRFLICLGGIATFDALISYFLKYHVDF